jgi:hypothetical protein
VSARTRRPFSPLLAGGGQRRRRQGRAQGVNVTERLSTL